MKQRIRSAFFAAALGGTCALGASQTNDAGYADKADISIFQGQRVIHLELVENAALIRSTKGTSAGAQFFTQIADRPADDFFLVSGDPNFPVFKSAVTQGGSLSDALVALGGYDFSGPVFKFGDATVAVGDQVNVRFAPGIDGDVQIEILKDAGLEVVRQAPDGFTVARILTSDGFDVLNAVQDLASLPEVLEAEPDWLYQVKLSSGYTDSFGGTSAAAPAAAGVAALVAAAAPTLTSAQIIQVMRDTADKIDPLNGLYDDAGQSWFYGFGRVDAEAALAQVTGLTSTGTVNYNDPLIPFQWHLDASNTEEAQSTADMNLPEAWDIWERVKPDTLPVVGVIDDGVYVGHQDLADAGQHIDTINDQNDPNPSGGESHGTSVAGIISGIANNGLGGAGVAPGFPISGARLITNSESFLIQDSDFELAFRTVTDAGSVVINNSWGPVIDADFCTATDDFVEVPATLGQSAGLGYALSNGRGGLGSVVVFSAGNDRARVDGFGLHSDPRVLTVSAINNVGFRSLYSNYGDSVDVSAPSNDLPGAAGSIPCFNEIYRGGTLGIVTADTSINGLGGEDLTIGNGAIGAVGVRDASGIITLPLETPVTISDVEYTQVGVDVLTLIDERGIIDGDVIFYYTNDFGDFLIIDDAPLRGRATASRTGVYLQDERYSGRLTMVARDRGLLFGVSTREAFRISNGVLSSGEPGFVGPFAVVIDDVISVRGEIFLGLLDRRLVSFAGDSTSPSARGRGAYLGTGRLISEFRTDPADYLVRAIPQTRRDGRFSTVARSGRYTATSIGTHGLDALPSDPLVFDAIGDLDRVFVRGPGGATSLRFD